MWQQAPMGRESVGLARTWGRRSNETERRLACDVKTTRGGTGNRKDLEGVRVSFKPEVTKQKGLAMAMKEEHCGSVRRRSYGGARLGIQQLAMEQQHLEVVEKPLQKEEHTSRQRSNIATIIARQTSRTRYSSALLTFTVLVLILTFRLPRGPAPRLSSSFPGIPTAALQISPPLPPFDSSPSFRKLPQGWSGVAQLRTGHGPTASSPVQRVQFFLRIVFPVLFRRVSGLVRTHPAGSNSLYLNSPL
ncbi:hypothetical protein C8R46DRAFT_1030662 [Mycena filopes]|nr:hypothetical protein C8R46DRAFT_1030662 [Mycena filopes]